jgi:hypothetical protein
LAVGFAAFVLAQEQNTVDPEVRRQIEAALKAHSATKCPLSPNGIAGRGEVATQAPIVVMPILKIPLEYAVIGDCGEEPLINEPSDLLRRGRMVMCMCYSVRLAVAGFVACYGSKPAKMLACLSISVFESAAGAERSDRVAAKFTRGNPDLARLVKSPPVPVAGSAEAGKTEVEQACKVPAKAKRDVVDVLLSHAIS